MEEYYQGLAGAIHRTVDNSFIVNINNLDFDHDTLVYTPRFGKRAGEKFKAIQIVAVGDRIYVELVETEDARKD